MIDDLTNYICNNYKNLHSKIYKLTNNSYIKFYSNNEDGIMQKYLSSDMCVNGDMGLDSSAIIYTVYLINIPYDLLPLSIKNRCATSSMRAKRMSQGYYNLHHFGDPIAFYEEQNLFFLFSDIKNCLVACWSYLIKWILTRCDFGTSTHLKGTLIKYKGKGILIIGDKSSGKSNLINKLFTYKMNSDDVALLANTHILLYKNSATGITSTINFRKEEARRIQKTLGLFPNIEINRCKNFDPVDLKYPIENNITIDKIYFYQHNHDGKVTKEILTPEEICLFIYMYSYGINFYRLQTDLREFLNNDMEEVSKKLFIDYNNIISLVKSVSEIACISADVNKEDEKIMKIISTIL